METDPASTVLGALLSGVSALLEPSSDFAKINEAAPAEHRPLRFSMTDKEISIHPSQIRDLALVDSGGGFGLSLSFGPEVAKWIFATTAQGPGRTMDMYLCDALFLSPRVMAPIKDGRVQISGVFELEELLAASAIIVGQVDCDEKALIELDAPSSAPRRAGGSREN